MKALFGHVSKTLIAGIVALLPIGGGVLGIVYLESILAEAWNGVQPLQRFYFPGLGLIAAVAVIYAIGLLVSTFVGRMVWSVFDGILTRLPLLGTLYNTLKQILGYGVGADAIFQRVVFVRNPDIDAEELGLVTNTRAEAGKLLVFIPGSPMPTAGRLLVIAAASTRAVDMSVKDALTALVSLGKSEMVLDSAAEPAPREGDPGRS